MNMLVADDHALFRAGLKDLLGRMEAGITVLEAEDYPQVRRHLREQPDLDLALLDLFMPGMNEIEGVQGLLQDHPTLPVVIVSASLEPSHMQAALSAGAMGYIPKHASPDLLLSALRLVLSGGIYVPPDLLGGDAVPEAEGLAHTRIPGDTIDLTSRQAQVLELLLAGCQNKSIARDLDISEGTVKAHLGAIFKVLGVSNRTQAVLRAVDVRITVRND